MWNQVDTTHIPSLKMTKSVITGTGQHSHNQKHKTCPEYEMVMTS